MDQHLHVAGVWRVAVEDFRRNKAATGLLGNQRVVGIQQATTVGVIGKKQIPQALLLSFGLQFANNGQHHPTVIQCRQFPVVLCLYRINLVGHEAFYPLQVILALG